METMPAPILASRAAGPPPDDPGLVPPGTAAALAEGLGEGLCDGVGVADGEGEAEGEGEGEGEGDAVELLEIGESTGAGGGATSVRVRTLLFIW